MFWYNRHNNNSLAQQTQQQRCSGTINPTTTLFWLHDIVHSFYAVSAVVYLKQFLDDDFMIAVIFDSTVFYTIMVKCTALVRLNCESLYIIFVCLFCFLFDLVQLYFISGLLYILLMSVVYIYVNTTVVYMTNKY